MTTTTPLVGREAQLRVVDSLIANLGGGKGGLLLIVGEPGIGKTRLAEEVVARAEAAGARSAWSSSWEEMVSPPLWSWSEILRQLTGNADALAAGPSSLGSSPESADFARFERFRAVGDALASAAAAQPIVVVVDDLQWADPASQQLLGFVAESVRQQSVLLVGTVRSGEAESQPMLDLFRRSTTLALGGLDPSEVHLVLEEAVGSPIDDEVGAAVVQRSGGNPLFVWEFGRLMASSGRTDVAATTVPAVVASVIDRRLARLSHDAVSRLQCAAVLGREFDLDDAEALEPNENPPENLWAEAANAGILLTTSPRRATFSHALLRQATYSGIDPARRSRLHAAAAERLRTRAESNPDLHASVAAHLDQAGTGFTSAPHWEAAGHRSMALLAYEQAADHFARALEAAPPPAPTPLLLARGEAQLRSGDLAGARTTFMAAAAAAQSTKDPVARAEAVLGMGAGGAGWEVPMQNEAYISAVEEALNDLPDDETALRSVLLSRLSVAAADPNDLEPARERAELALHLAEEAGDTAAACHALAALCDAISGPAHAAARRAHAASLIALAQTIHDPGLTLLGRRFLVVALMELGRWEELSAEVARFRQGADELRQPLISWYAPLFEGALAHLHGDLDTADRLNAEVHRAAETTGSLNALMLAATQENGLRLTQGLGPAEFPTIPGADPEVWASYAAAKSHAAIFSGERAQGEWIFRLYADNGFARIGDDSERLSTLFGLPRVAIELGDRPAAERLHDLYEVHRDLWVIDGIGAMCMGPVELELALLDVFLDRRDEAIEHLTRARPTLEAAGAKLLLAEADSLLDELGANTLPPPDAPPRSIAPQPGNSASAWRRQGEFWSISFDDHQILMKNSKGLADIARLLGRPGAEVHVLDLYGAPPERGTSSPGSLGEALDPQARAAYRQRLEDLEEDLAEAEDNHDQGQVERLQSERDFIARELASALGLGGRARRTGDPDERARKAVGMRIRLTIDRIEAQHPRLAGHLRNSIRTGAFCSYQPESAVDWEI